MNRKDRWILDDEDIIRTETLQPLLSDKPVTSIIEDLDQKVYQRFKAHSDDANNAISLHNSGGLTCRVLIFHPKKWISGKIRYVLEFEPDDPAEMLEIQASMQNNELMKFTTIEEPLDEIRKLSE